MTTSTSIIDAQEHFEYHSGQSLAGKEIFGDSAADILCSQPGAFVRRQHREEVRVRGQLLTMGDEM